MVEHSPQILASETKAITMNTVAETSGRASCLNCEVSYVFELVFRGNAKLRDIDNKKEGWVCGWVVIIKVGGGGRGV